MADEAPLFKDAPAGVDTGYLGYLTESEQTALNTLKEELTTLVCTYFDELSFQFRPRATFILHFMRLILTE